MASPRSVTGASTSHGAEPPGTEPSGVGRHDLHLLGAHRLLRRSAVERQHRGGLLDARRSPGAIGALRRRPSAVLELDVREADQGPARQVGDEEGDPGRAERQAQLTGDGLDGLDGRGRLWQRPGRCPGAGP